MRYFQWTALVFIVGIASYFAGSSFGDYLAERKRSSFKARRTALTLAVSSQRINLGVGDTIPDIQLETLEGDTIELQVALTLSYENARHGRVSAIEASQPAGLGESYLVVVHPHCATCVEEMAEIARIQTALQLVGPFVFLSPANPRECLDVRDSLALENVFLYDHRGHFLYSFGLDTYPLVLVVDHNRVVQDMIIGTLLPSEIEDAISDSDNLPN